MAIWACIPTNSVRGFQFLHAHCSIYWLWTFWWWLFWLVWDDTSFFKPKFLIRFFNILAGKGLTCWFLHIYIYILYSIFTYTHIYTHLVFFSKAYVCLFLSNDKAYWMLKIIIMSWIEHHFISNDIFRKIWLKPNQIDGQRACIIQINRILFLCWIPKYWFRKSIT